MGRTKLNKVVVFDNSNDKYQPGDSILVKINKSNSATLFGEVQE